MSAFSRWRNISYPLMLFSGTLVWQLCWWRVDGVATQEALRQPLCRLLTFPMCVTLVFFVLGTTSDLIKWVWSQAVHRSFQGDHLNAVTTGSNTRTTNGRIRSRKASTNVNCNRQNQEQLEHLLPNENQHTDQSLQKQDEFIQCQTKEPPQKVRMINLHPEEQTLPVKSVDHHLKPRITNIKEQSNEKYSRQCCEQQLKQHQDLYQLQRKPEEQLYLYKQHHEQLVSQRHQQEYEHQHQQNQKPKSEKHHRHHCLQHQQQQEQQHHRHQVQYQEKIMSPRKIKDPHEQKIAQMVQNNLQRESGLSQEGVKHNLQSEGYPHPPCVNYKESSSFGLVVELNLNSMEKNQALFARKEINNILYRGNINALPRCSSSSSESYSLPSVTEVVCQECCSKYSLTPGNICYNNKEPVCCFEPSLTPACYLNNNTAPTHCLKSCLTEPVCCSKNSPTPMCCSKNSSRAVCLSNYSISPPFCCSTNSPNSVCCEKDAVVNRRGGCAGRRCGRYCGRLSPALAARIARLTSRVQSSRLVDIF